MGRSRYKFKKFEQLFAIVNENAPGDIMALQLQISKLKEELHQSQSQNALLMEPSNLGRNDNHDVIDVFGEGCFSLGHVQEDDRFPNSSSKKLRNLEAVVSGALRREQAVQNEAKQLSAYIEKLKNFVEEQQGEIQRHQLLASAFSSKDISIFEDEVRLGKRPRIAQDEGAMKDSKLEEERTNLLQELKSFQKFNDAREEKVWLDKIANLQEQVICLIEEKAKHEQSPNTTIQTSVSRGNKEDQITDATLELRSKIRDSASKRDISFVREEDQSLASMYENGLKQRDDETNNLDIQWEGTATALIRFLDEGNQALDDAMQELEGILDYSLPEGLKESYLGSSAMLVEEREKNNNLQQMIHHVYKLVKTVEGRVGGLCKTTDLYKTDSSEVKSNATEDIFEDEEDLDTKLKEKDDKVTENMQPLLCYTEQLRCKKVDLHEEKVGLEAMVEKLYGEEESSNSIEVEELKLKLKQSEKQRQEAEARNEKMRSMLEKLVIEIQEKDGALMLVREELENALSTLQDVQFDAESEEHMCQERKYLELLVSQLENAHQDINEKQMRIEALESAWKEEKQGMLLELDMAKLNVVEKMSQTWEVMKEAEIVLNALTQKNERSREEKINMICQWEKERNDLIYQVKELGYSVVTLEENLATTEKVAVALANNTKQEITTFLEEFNHSINECKIESLEKKITNILIKIAEKPIAEEELCTLFADKFQSIISKVENDIIVVQKYAENSWERLERVTEEKETLEKELERNQELLKGSIFDLNLLQEHIAGSENTKNELKEAKALINDMQNSIEKTSVQCSLLRQKNRDLQRSLIRKNKGIDKLDLDILEIAERVTLLEKENNTVRGDLEQSVKRNLSLQDELEENKRIIKALETDLFQMRSNVEQKVVRFKDEINHGKNSIVKERDQLHIQLLLMSEELQTSRALAKKNITLADEAQQDAETNKKRAEEKEKEAMFLEQSVVELENMVATLETQVNVLKSESERQKISREDLEMQLQELRYQKSEMREEYHMETIDPRATLSVKDTEHQILQTHKEIKHLGKLLKEKNAQINAYRARLAELTTVSERQAAENYQKLHDLEITVEKMKTGRALQEKEIIHKNSSKSNNKALKRSRSPFRCMKSGLVHQVHYEINEELQSSRQKIEELQALADSQKKEILLLRTRLTEAECMTRDVIRDLVEVKLDITSCTTWLDQKQVEKLLKETLKKDEELKTIRVQFVEEKESWLERNKRRQAELVAAQIKAEKLRLKERMLAAQNKRLKMEISSQKKELTELQGEIQRLAKTAGVVDTCLHDQLDAKCKSEDLYSRLRNTKDLLNCLTDQLDKQIPDTIHC